MNGTRSTREQRLVLVLVCGACVWRWLVAQRTPLPGTDACLDLWLAGEAARGGFDALAARAAAPWWSLLLAPVVACGASPFFAAQLLASVLGGLAVWPVAAAAERLREGAGLPAAVLATVAAGPAVAAGAGSAHALHGLLVAGALAAAAHRRAATAVVLAVLAALGGIGDTSAAPGAVSWLRLGCGAAAALAPLVVLPPRSARALVFLVAWPVAFAAALASGSLAMAAAWSPVLAVVAGVGLARLGARWREVLLCGAVAAEFHGGWNEIEPRDAVAQRVIGRFVARHFAAGAAVASDLARVVWAAGQRPQAMTRDELIAAAARREPAVVVLGPQLAKTPTVTASLAGSYARAELPADLVDLLEGTGMSVFVRR